VDPFYRLQWEDGEILDYNNDQDFLEEQIRARNPDDVEGYRKFLAYSQELYREGYEKLGYAQVSKFVKNEKTRQLLSFQSLLVGGNPFATSSIYGLIHALERKGGVWFAKGGTGALVAGLVRLFKDIGGELRLNAEVTDIHTVGDRVTGVTTKDGWIRHADMVASNADVVHTYSKLLRKHKRGQKYGKALTKKRHSMSLFVIYFGLAL